MVQFSRQVPRDRPIRHTRQQQRRRLDLPKCLHHIATERFRRIEISAGVIPQQHAGDVPVLHPHIACGEHRHDDYHSDRGRHGRGWANPTDLELRRFFAHGDLRLVILRLIAEKLRHSYEIIKEIEERVAGAYSPGPGVIYPTLTPWEEPGYIAVSPGEAARKLHETPRRDERFSPPTDRRWTPCLPAWRRPARPAAADSLRKSCPRWRI